MGKAGVSRNWAVHREGTMVASIRRDLQPSWTLIERRVESSPPDAPDRLWARLISKAFQAGAPRRLETFPRVYPPSSIGDTARGRLS